MHFAPSMPPQKKKKKEKLEICVYKQTLVHILILVSDLKF